MLRATSVWWWWWFWWWWWWWWWWWSSSSFNTYGSTCKRNSFRLLIELFKVGVEILVSEGTTLQQKWSQHGTSQQLLAHNCIDHDTLPCSRRIITAPSSNTSPLPQKGLTFISTSNSSLPNQQPTTSLKKNTKTLEGYKDVSSDVKRLLCIAHLPPAPYVVLAAAPSVPPTSTAPRAIAPAVAPFPPTAWRPSPTSAVGQIHLSGKERLQANDESENHGIRCLISWY